MSMNLKCDRLELRQTPTYITYMCMVRPEGLCIDLEGEEAKQSLRIYKEWVKGTLNRSYKSAEDYDDEHKYVNEEIKLIDEVIKSRKKLRVYIE